MTWTRLKDSGSYRLDLPGVGFLGLVQREGKQWRAVLFRAGARLESPLFPRLAEAQASVEDRCRRLLQGALAVLGKEKGR